MLKPLSFLSQGNAATGVLKKKKVENSLCIIIRLSKKGL